MLAEPPIESTPASTSAPPDWSAVTKDIVCPLCEYNLRGLTDTRCPECGYTFVWEEVLNPEILRHPYLFEHNPRRNVRSFFATLFKGLRPRRFWSSLRATHQPRPKRLLLYALLCGSLLILVAAAGFIRTAYDMKEQLARSRRSHLQWLKQDKEQEARLINRWGSLDAYMDSIYPPVMSRRFVQFTWSMTLQPGWRGGATIAAVPSCLAVVLWPWLTFLTLMIFLASMRRASVRPIHVARCAIYSSDAIWMVPVVIAIMPDQIPLMHHYVYAVGRGNVQLMVLAICFAALGTWRLAAAYRFYLKFPHAIAVAVASQLIIVLAVVIYALNAGY